MTQDHTPEVERAPGAHVSPFESIKHVADDGTEYWSARDLSKILGYSQWQTFHAAVERARVAATNSDQDAATHFRPTTAHIASGKKTVRPYPDYHLSRYACYLIIQNADPSKDIVALGQTYFAVQTRRQEQADELAGLTENQKRLYLRGQLADHNRQLADAARGAGVIVARDFAIFQDHGYRGLYGGLDSRTIHTRKGLAKNEAILDHMASEELAANLFRATQAEAKIRRERVQGKEDANRTHYAVGREVRDTIGRLGGTMPEDVPTPEKSTQHLARERTERERMQLQPPLFTEVVPED